MISMECAIRLVNLIWAYAFLKSVLSTKAKKNILQLTHSLANHIYHNIEYSFTPGNHYFSNGVGLLYAGLFLPFREGKLWLQKSLNIIEDSINNQVLADGISFEKSVHYHRLVAEFALHAFLLSQQFNLKIKMWVEEKLEKMLEFTTSYTKPNGSCPLIGDNDDGKLIFLEDCQNINDHRHLLSTGAVLFSRGDFKTASNKLSEETIWLLGPEAGAVWDKTKKANLKSEAFVYGGYYVMRSKNLHLIVDCGELGLKGRGGHGHNDTLSFELSVGGQALITDSGSYIYSRNFDQRNNFRSTKAHNTIVIDNQEIAPFDKNDIWIIPDITNVKVTNWKSNLAEDVLVGEHSGYSRFGITHQRKISLDKKNDLIQIIDCIVGESEDIHDIELRLHFAPDVKLNPNKTKVLASIQGKKILLEFSGAENMKIENCWISPSYGKKLKSKVLIVSKATRGPAKIITNISEVKGLKN
jgi:hypothetical protein